MAREIPNVIDTSKHNCCSLMEYRVSFQMSIIILILHVTGQIQWYILNSSQNINHEKVVTSSNYLFRYSIGIKEELDSDPV